MQSNSITKPVSNHNYTPLFRVCHEGGHDIEELLEGTNETISSLLNTSGYTSWEDFVKIGNKLFSKLDDTEIKKAAYYGVFAKEYGKFHNILTGLLTPAFMFYAQYKFIGKMLFKNSTYIYERVSKEKIILTIEFHESTPLPSRLWESYEEVYSLFPTFVGGKRARVKREESGNKCRFDINLTLNISPIQRLKNLYKYMQGTKSNLNLLAELHDSRLEIEKLNQELLVTNKELDLSRKLNNIILGSLGHDIKSPLQIIGLATNGIRKNFERNQIDRIESKLEKIERQITTITEISDSGKNLANQLSTANLKKVIGDKLIAKNLVLSTIQNYKVELSDKDIELDIIDNIKEDKYIFVNSVIFSNSIIANLLSNAIKFTPHRGNITIEMNANDSSFNFKVIDTGIGISPDQLQEVLKFESRTTTRGTSGEIGTGLGLSIVNELVTYYKGNIEIFSSQEENNTGTIVSITLPLYQDAVTKEESPRA